MRKMIWLLLPALLLSACTKLQRAKWAYSRGNYAKAVGLLEEAVKTDQTDPAIQKYLVIARAGLWTDQAAKAMEGGDYVSAIERLDDALGLDPKNADAQPLLNRCIEKLKEAIQNDLIPGKRWEKVAELAALIQKYRPEESSFAALEAEAVYHQQNDALNWRSIPAIERAYPKAPDNAFLKEKTEILAAKSLRFRELFDRYENALAGKNFKAWRDLISSRHLTEANVDLRNLAEKGDTDVKTLEDYFKVIAEDPAKYGSPEGAQVVCVEPFSDAHAFVHFKYRGLPKVLKMEVVSEGGALKLHREADSEISAANLPPAS